MNRSPGTVIQAVRPRFWAESALGCTTALLSVLTTVWHDWIETVLGVDPDHGNGGLEWAVVAALALCAATALSLAGSEWRHTQRRLAVVTQP